MAQDKIGGIVRALVGVPQERLTVVQRVVNSLNSADPNGDQFQIELSKFVLGWKSTIAVEIQASPVSDLDRWSATYEKLFGKKPELSEIRIPEKPEGVGPVRLVVVARELVEWSGKKHGPLQGVMETLKKKFPCYQYDNNLDKAVPTNDRDLKNGSYAVWVKDVREADDENANKSADDLKAEGHTGITLLERQLLEADYFFEKGEHLDIVNITLCAGSRDADGDVPGACWYGSKFRVCWCSASPRHGLLRSRRVWA